MFRNQILNGNMTKYLSEINVHSQIEERDVFHFLKTLLNNSRANLLSYFEFISKFYVTFKISKHRVYRKFITHFEVHVNNPIPVVIFIRRGTIRSRPSCQKQCIGYSFAKLNWYSMYNNRIRKCVCLCWKVNELS